MGTRTFRSQMWLAFYSSLYSCPRIFPWSRGDGCKEQSSKWGQEEAESRRPGKAQPPAERTLEPRSWGLQNRFQVQVGKEGLSRGRKKVYVKKEGRRRKGEGWRMNPGGLHILLKTWSRQISRSNLGDQRETAGGINWEDGVGTCIFPLRSKGKITNRHLLYNTGRWA